MEKVDYKSKLIPLIKFLSVNNDEFLVNIDFIDININSIEWCRCCYSIYLYSFQYDDALDDEDGENDGQYDIVLSYDDLSEIAQKEVYYLLLREFLN